MRQLFLTALRVAMVGGFGSARGIGGERGREKRRLVGGGGGGLMSSGRVRCASVSRRYPRGWTGSVLGWMRLRAGEGVHGLLSSEGLPTRHSQNVRTPPRQKQEMASAIWPALRLRISAGVASRQQASAVRNSASLDAPPAHEAIKLSDGPLSLGIGFTPVASQPIPTSPF